MIRIAMLGCDSSHTEAYSELLHKKDSPFYGKARIEWLWGEDIHQATEKAAACGIKQVVQSLDDACLNEADFFMVLGRYGSSHYIPTKKAIGFGKPIYVDKPFTNSYSEAIELKQFAKEKNIPLASFSPLRFSAEVLQLKKSLNKNEMYGAVISGPAKTDMIKDPRAQQLHFYGIHAVDILCALYGTGVKKIKADKSEKGIWVGLEYENGKHATLNMPYNASEFYHMVVYSKNGVVAQNIDPYGTFYEETMKALLEELAVRNCTRMPIEEACEGIKLLDSIESSIHSKEEIKFHETV